jgi:acyl carrier protein
MISEHLEEPQLEMVSRAIAAACQTEPIVLSAGDRLVADLGFNSLRIAALALEIGRELGCPVLLNDWLAQARNIDDLTVGSLCEFLRSDVSESG